MKRLRRLLALTVLGLSFSSFAAVDALDTNLTALVCLDRVERTLLCGEPREKANRTGILRTLGELDRRFSRSEGHFTRAADWMLAGLLGEERDAQLASLDVAYARLMRFAGILFGFPDYAARGRALHERLIARCGGEEPVFRKRDAVPEDVRAYDALMAENRRDLRQTIRSGGNGRPFWNGNARLFIYPPSFDFPTREGAVSYRLTVTDDRLEEHVFEAKSPQTALTPVWAELPVGFASVRCEALDASGRALGTVQTRRFWRSAPFDPAEYAPPRRDYATARRLALRHLFDWPEIAFLEKHGHPDISAGSNFTSYPSKMQSAVIAVMLEIAREIPECRERALRVAVTSADYLLSVRERPGTPLSGFTATYVGKGQLSGTYAGQHMLVYPAEAGAAFLKLWKATGETRYLEAARLIAETYLRLQGKDGTWYLKMNASDGTPVGPNRLIPTSVMRFLEDLHRATGEKTFRTAADRAFASIDRGPLVDWNWEGQFEDIAPSSRRYQNLTKHMACETALYLLERFPGDKSRLAQARDILRFSEDQFVMWKTPCRSDGTGPWSPTYPFFAWRTPAVLEQYGCYSPIDASAAKLVKTYLALYRAEGRPLDLAKAKALANSMVNNQDADGRIRTYWIPEPGDDDPLAGAIRLPRGGDWFNCMAADVEALSELIAAPRPDLVAEVASGARTTARASWWGFSEEDSTACLQKAIDSGVRKLIVDNVGKPWIVRPLKGRSNLELQFEKGVELQAKRNEFHRPMDCLFSCRGVSNIVLSGAGATFRMHVEDYTNAALYAKSEWRHAIGLWGVSDFRIEGLRLVASGGDGIYFGTQGPGRHCRNGVVRDVVSERNNRQGMSVISADNLLIERCVCRLTRGARPQAGIDIEPNRNTDVLKNIVLRDCLVEDNAECGYELEIAALDCSSQPVSVRLENCRSRGNGRACRWIRPSNPLRGFSGHYEFVNCDFADRNQNLDYFRPAAGEASSMSATFENCTILDPADPTRRIPVTGGWSKHAGLSDARGERLRMISADAKALARARIRDRTPGRPVATSSIAFRRGNTFLLYATKANPTVLKGRLCRAGGSRAASRAKSLKLSVGGLTGSYRQDFTLALDAKSQGEIVLDVPQDGFYSLQFPRTGEIWMFTETTVPLAACFDRCGLEPKMNGIGGDVWFSVPPGSTGFAFFACGGDIGEGVAADLYAPDGEKVWSADNVCESACYSCVRNVRAGLWRVAVRKAGKFVLDDFSLDLLGVPVHFFLTPEKTWDWDIKGK